MFTNKKDCMHFHFSEHDHEIAIVVMDDIEGTWIEKFTGNIPVYRLFDNLPHHVSSVVVLSSCPIDETLLPQHRDISYIFIGYGMFIIPPSCSVISLCVEDDESLQSIFEAICTSEENYEVINIDPLESDLNGKRFQHIRDILLQEVNMFDFKALEEIDALWFHQRSLLTVESITQTNERISKITNFLCHSGIISDQNHIRIIGIQKPMEQLTSKYPCEIKMDGVMVCFRIGDITRESCDAIVNSANIYLKQGSGVCGAIFSAAGPELKHACTLQIQHHGGAIRVGQSVVTEGFNLKAKYIIHSVSPRCMFQWNDKLQSALYKTYNTIYETAEQKGFVSIALPAMGIGKHYCDIDRSVSTAMAALEEYLSHSAKTLKRIIFVLNDEETAEKYYEYFSCMSHYKKAMNIKDHQEGFENEAKFHRALRYMLIHNSRFKTKQLKHILKIFNPELVLHLFNRKPCRRTIRYTGESNDRFRHGKLYHYGNGTKYWICLGTERSKILASIMV